MVSTRPYLIIRADAGVTMGTGHVMRCLALAQGWQEREGKVLFAGRIPSHSLQGRIRNEGFNYVDIRRPYPEHDDLELMLSLIKKGGMSDSQWVVVDGYHFTADYARCLREAGAKVLVIDDYAHQAGYQADLLLNQNLGSQELSYTINSDATILAGSNYVLLRREFLSDKCRDTGRPTVASHILVTQGGSDPENVTLKVIEALERVDLPQLKVKIIVGPANSNREMLKNLLSKVSFPGEVFPAVGDMVPLMKWADMAITAGGSTCWELAYLGVPALILTVAENQFGVAEGMAAAGAGWNCGRSQTVQIDRLAGMIEELCNDGPKRQAMAWAGQKLVDGWGAERVVERMVSFPFSFRAVRADDCRLLFDWANDPVVRKASFLGEAIGWEEHQQWLRRRLNDENCLFWIVRGQGGQPAGQVRFDIAGDEAVISISLSRAMRNKGQGSKVIKLACRKLFAKRQICLVKAFVKIEHRQSIISFERAGFTWVSEEIIHGVSAVEMSLMDQ